MFLEKVIDSIQASRDLKISHKLSSSSRCNVAGKRHSTWERLRKIWWKWSKKRRKWWSDIVDTLICQVVMMMSVTTWGWLRSVSTLINPVNGQANLGTRLLSYVWHCVPVTTKQMHDILNTFSGSHFMIALKDTQYQESLTTSRRSCLI